MTTIKNKAIVLIILELIIIALALNLIITIKRDYKYKPYTFYELVDGELVEQGELSNDKH